METRWELSSVHDGDRGVQLEADAKAHNAMPKAAAVNWSLAADRRLDQLVAAAHEAGAGTRRNELLAAIVASTPKNEEALLRPRRRRRGGRAELHDSRADLAARVQRKLKNETSVRFGIKALDPCSARSGSGGLHHS